VGFSFLFLYYLTTGDLASSAAFLSIKLLRPIKKPTIQIPLNRGSVSHIDKEGRVGVIIGRTYNKRNYIQKINTSDGLKIASLFSFSFLCMDSNHTNKNGVVLELWKRPKESIKTAR